MKKLLGFTLSELIIAIAVVGIIAAVTVPALVQHYQKDMQVTMLKKMYNDLQNNLTQLQTENINSDFKHSRLGENSADVEGFFDDYYNVKRKCGTNPVPCFASSYRNIENSGSIDTDFDLTDNSYCVLLIDGASICIVPQHFSAISGPTDPHVYVDVNGPDKPNIGGRDMFVMGINSISGTVDVVSSEHYNTDTIEQFREYLFNDYCRSSHYGIGCFGKILNDDWKMNY